MLVETTLATSLRAAYHDRKGLRSALIRMALTDNSTASTAVLHALFAFSAAASHRHNVRIQAEKHKFLAIQALRKSAFSGIDATMISQHMAANMLLCSSEVWQSFHLGLFIVQS